MARTLRYWTEEEKNFLKANYHLLSINELSETLERKPSLVYDMAWRIGGLTTKRNYFFKNKKTNHSYFRTITTPAQAFILGWLAADGCVTDKGDIRIHIQKRDKDILEYIRKELSPFSTVFEDNRNAVGLFLRSREMKEDLKAYGVVPRKTAVFEWPHNLPEQFDKDFLCGYFEGDGCLGVYSGRAQWILVGSKKFLEAVVKKIKKNLAIDINPPRQCGRAKPLYKIVAPHNKANKIDSWISKDIYGLKRKHLTVNGGSK